MYFWKGAKGAALLFMLESPGIDARSKTYDLNHYELANIDF